MRASTIFGLAAATSAASASAIPAHKVVARDSNPGCTADSFSSGFEWTISNVVYNTSIVQTTPAHQIPNGVVQFNLTNPALTYTAACVGYSTQLSEFFYGDIIYTCTEPSDATTTTFTFNAGTSQLNVNQSWVCSDESAEYPTTFKYAGTVNLAFDCTSTHYENDDWSIGEIYKTNATHCAQNDVTIKPYLATATA